MTAEWMLTNEKITDAFYHAKDFANLMQFELDGRREVAKAQAKKLLEYLIVEKAIGVSVEDNDDDEIKMVEVESLEQMLKQLEKGQ